mgnify:FL=1
MLFRSSPTPSTPPPQSSSTSPLRPSSSPAPSCGSHSPWRSSVPSSAPSPLHQNRETHLATKTHVDSVLLVVAHAEELHERVARVALFERADHFGAFYGVGGVSGSGGGKGRDERRCWCSARGGCIATRVWGIGEGRSKKMRAATIEFTFSRSLQPSLKQGKESLTGCQRKWTMESWGTCMGWRGGRKGIE